MMGLWPYLSRAVRRRRTAWLYNVNDCAGFNTDATCRVDSSSLHPPRPARRGESYYQRATSSVKGQRQRSSQVGPLPLDLFHSTDRTSFSCPVYAVAYGARPFLREWGERSGYASNPAELATHRLCDVGVRVRLEP
eukprot:5855654-Pleurochrysis_carterae.AAC.1